MKRPKFRIAGKTARRAFFAFGFGFSDADFGASDNIGPGDPSKPSVVIGTSGPAVVYVCIKAFSSESEIMTKRDAVSPLGKLPLPTEAYCAKIFTLPRHTF